MRDTHLVFDGFCLKFSDTDTKWPSRTKCQLIARMSSI